MRKPTGVKGLTLKDSIWQIDKQIKGYGRLCESTGESSLPRARAYLERRLFEIRTQLEKLRENGGVPRRTFKEAALRYVSENKHIDTIDGVMHHLLIVAPFINDLPLDQVHDDTLKPFVTARKQRTVARQRLSADGAITRLEAPVTNRTINATLEVVRRVLNASARSYRDNLEDGTSRPWLSVAPSITMLPKDADAREPYPLSWEEERALFEELPAHLRRMALFKVNTGTREQEVCSLRWEWEVKVDALQTSVFIIPKKIVKNNEDRIVVLNRVAKEVVDGCRGMHPEFVFVYRKNLDRFDWKGSRRSHASDAGEPVTCMNNNAWQKARVRAALKLAEKNGCPPERMSGLASVRVHDLKHTYGRRLRASGVPFETRQALLGHTNGEITTHYSAAEIGELLEASNRVCASENGSVPTLTVLRRTASAFSEK